MKLDNREEQMHKPFNESPGIPAEDLAAEAAAGTVLVDVREVSETAGGVIPGALCLPLSQLGARIDALPREQRLAVYCRSGIRSDAACRMLRQAGYDAHNVLGGYERWRLFQGR